MARTAIGKADAIYITSDNPRTEDPNFIISQIVAGIPQNNRKPVIFEPDRRKAIAKILADAKPDDVILLAGKGHENYQVLGRPNIILMMWRRRPMRCVLPLDISY